MDLILNKRFGGVLFVITLIDRVGCTRFNGVLKAPDVRIVIVMAGVRADELSIMPRMR